MLSILDTLFVLAFAQKYTGHFGIYAVTILYCTTDLVFVCSKHMLHNGTMIEAFGSEQQGVRGIDQAEYM